MTSLQSVPSSCPPCPLCDSSATSLFAQDKRRCYHRCGECGLVWVPQRYFLDRQAEKEVYDQHCNDPGDMAYRRFLGRLFQPLSAQLQSGANGLDFGSGPGPTLSVMFAELGHTMTIFDPYYANDAMVWQHQYDFITATEVVEHLHSPRFELERLWSHLKDGGRLGVMTKMVLDADAFARWHYKNDPTHVTFFAVDTFTWLAQHWDAQLQFVAADAVIFRKNSFD